MSDEVQVVPAEGEKSVSADSPTSYTAEDMAAHDFQRLVPLFWQALEPLSRRQEQRVFMALVQYPLEGQFPKFSYPQESKAFLLGLQVFDCKFVLMKAVLELTANKEKMEKFNAELQEAKKEKTEDGLQGGLPSNEGQG